MTPKNNRIVIVGGIACGTKAAARARRMDPNAEITLIDKGSHISYAGCGLPYYVAGAVKELDGLMTTPYGVVRDADFFHKGRGVNVQLRTEVTDIDRKSKIITCRNRDTEQETTISYDHLVLATGARPIMPPIEGVDLNYVFKLRSPKDAAAIFNAIEEVDAEKAVIIGGGRIGLEIGDALNAQAVDCTIVELADQLLPTSLDREFAVFLENTLGEMGVSVFIGEKVLKLVGDAKGNVTKVVTDKRELDADMVLIGTGVRPNVDLARKIGLEIGETGGIVVNKFMQTSDPHIYAGGDCVECHHIVTGQKVYASLGSTANKHGRIIGTNITGGHAVCPGVLGTGILKTYGLNIAKTGILEKEAKALGIPVITATTPFPDRSHFFPGGKMIIAKVIAHAHTEKILGGQVIGPGAVDKRIDVLVAAITFGATIDELASLDLAYAPPFSTAIDPLAYSAMVVANKRDRLGHGISQQATLDKINQGEDFVMLDLRTEKELDLLPAHAPNLLHIPVEQLRGRLDEVPRDKEIICLCKVGARGYEGQRILIGAGYENVKFLEGGAALWTKFYTGVEKA